MKILISAAGGGGTNGILSTYSNNEIEFFGINSNKYDVVSSVTNITYLVDRATNEKNYIRQVNKIIDKHQIDFFIPNSDIEVEIVSKYINKIKTRTFVPNLDEIIISNDKFKTYQHCIENGINVPKTIEFESFEELEKKFTEFNKFPLWCRIKEGSGSKFTSPIYNFNEAVQFISNAIEHNELKITDFTVSDYLPGDDCLVSSIWKEGKLVSIVMGHRMKYAKKPGQSPPVLIKKIFRKELFDFAHKVINSLSEKPHGIYNLDVKYDVNNEVALTEFNLGRFYYNMPLFNQKSNFFNSYIDSIVLGLDVEQDISTNEAYFIRNQDNFPVVVSEEEFQNKISRID